MSALTKALLIVVLSLATAILVIVAFARPGVESIYAVPAALIAAGAIGVVVGITLRAAVPRPEPRSPQPTDADAAASGDVRGARETAEPLPTDQTFLLFAQELVSATTIERLRAVLIRHLPPLVGSRRVWLTSHLQGRTQMIIPEQTAGTDRDKLLDDGAQEWTTFLLRVETSVIGVLGVESRSGLSPRVKHLIPHLTPMIAQALHTAQTMDALRETSLVDLLTGVATRREGITRLGAEIKRAQRTGMPMAVMMLDLDRFKAINDRFGHAIGDSVLTGVGRTMVQKLRASDIRCRWGGEEFLIVLPETDLTRAQGVATGLLRDIAALKVSTPAGVVGTTASIGLTMARPGETNSEAIIRRADMALYQAKAAGRACVRVVLGDQQGEPVAVGPTRPADKSPPSTLPFPDRRNQQRPDRRRVPGPGRRRTDPPPQWRENRDPTAAPDARRRENSRR
jgi:diguanylate cyclase (GGDEF)-like protein